MNPPEDDPSGTLAIWLATAVATALTSLVELPATSDATASRGVGCANAAAGPSTRPQQADSQIERVMFDSPVSVRVSSG